jgi:hypothetical protein
MWSVLRRSEVCFGDPKDGDCIAKHDCWRKKAWNQGRRRDVVAQRSGKRGLKSRTWRSARQLDAGKVDPTSVVRSLRAITSWTFIFTSSLSLLLLYQVNYSTPCPPDCSPRMHWLAAKLQSSTSSPHEPSHHAHHQCHANNGDTKVQHPRP